MTTISTASPSVRSAAPPTPGTGRLPIATRRGSVAPPPPDPAEMSLHGMDLDLTGWFQIGWSDEVGVGDVIPKRYFGVDLVVYRGNDGVVRVHDRYCQHLGASLAHGGCVTDEGIQCPFHGWVWSPEGTNVSIPYQPDRPNKARRLGTWPTAEVNESLYVWNDPTGGEPTWQVVDALTLTTQAAATEFHPAGSEGRGLWAGTRIHPQMVVENAVDPHHFHFVHRTQISPVVLEEVVSDHEWHSRVGFGRRWSKHVEDGLPPDPDTRNTIDLLWQGMGVSVNTERTPDGIRVIAINTTPVEDGSSDMFATYWIEKHDGDLADGEFARRMAEVKISMPDDIKIWDNQMYMDPPALATSEGAGFRKMRIWSARFFPETSLFRQRHTPVDAGQAGS
jgi:3-ketosteroid 9alpha-monooxygenase subunit A